MLKDKVKMSTEEDKPYWKFNKSEILSEFNQTSTGFTRSQVEKIRESYGFNEIIEEEGESLIDKIKEQFEDILVRILLAAAVVSFILALTTNTGDEGISAYLEPFVILLILVANATIGIWQDINADKAIAALKKLQATHTSVKRDNQMIIVDAKELVPGDLIHLKEGERVPADVRIVEIETSNFIINQSIFTGETQQVYKISEQINNDQLGIIDRTNIAFSSTSVIYGSGWGIVIETGSRTQLGKLHSMICGAIEKEEKSPLKKKLDEFGNWLTYIIGAICLIVWIMNFKNFFDEVHGNFLNGCIYYFKIAVALAVAAIPEGLPAVITTCLALGSQRMSECNTIVRKLDSIETLGCTTVICSDKTGTLTTNNMTVSRVMYFKDNVKDFLVRSVSGVSFEPKGIVEGLTVEEINEFKNIKVFADCCAVNNLSTIFSENDIYSISGTPTEGALRVLVEKLKNFDKEFKDENECIMQYNNYLTSKYSLLYTLEFDRDRKSMGILAINNHTDKPILFIKGAAEILVNKSNKYMIRNGDKRPFLDNEKEELIGFVSENFMKKSLRTLAICVKEELPELDGIDIRSKEELKKHFKDLTKFSLIENHCTLIGFVGMLDPPRPEVKEAIETCKEAGLRVIMITGDNKLTADSIARQIGIVEEENLKQQSWIASEFFKLDEREQMRLLKEEFSLVISRSEPKHKINLINILKIKCVKEILN